MLKIRKINYHVLLLIFGLFAPSEHGSLIESWFADVVHRGLGRIPHSVRIGAEIVVDEGSHVGHWRKLAVALFIIDLKKSFAADDSKF